MKFTCPECQTEHAVEPVALFAGEHQLAFTITPTPGGALSPLHVGGMMRSMERLLVAIGKDAGFKSAVTITGLSVGPDGEICVKVRLVRRSSNEV